MLVRDLMTTGVEMVQADAPVAEAAERMATLDVGVLPVWDGREVIGMLTDRDITVRATAAGEDAESARVRDVMTPQVLFCFDDIDVEEASRAMAERQIRRLAVLNRDNKLVGVISLGDSPPPATPRRPATPSGKSPSPSRLHQVWRPTPAGIGLWGVCRRVRTPPWTSL